MKWDQQKVLKFSEDRFGEQSAMDIAVRGNKEMSELLSSLCNGLVSNKDVAFECADIVIFMMQIAEKVGYDLLETVDEKMDINEGRKWKRNADGSFQHV